MNEHHDGRRLFVPAFGILALCLAAQDLRAQNTFKQTNLISDIPGMAVTTDPNLVNPWGISFSPTSPFWIADNGSGKSTLYSGTGGIIPLVVSIPGAGNPTGTVFNGGSAFNGDRFLFASEDGTISGWRGALGTSAETLKIAGDEIYKGLAIGSTGGFTYLYASDFRGGKIDVLPASGAPALSGSFTDPSIPSGFAPFNIQNLGGQLFVTYAKQDAGGEDDVAGAGNGFVDVFDLNGNFVKRLISSGPLNSPWGLTMAPAGFGPFGGDLLVGNFGDGSINVFDSSTGTFVDALKNPSSNPVVIDGLWGLTFGNGGSGGAADTLYFTAGIPGDGAVEDHGLFGSLAHVPDNGMTLFMVAAGLAGILGFRRHPAFSIKSRA